MVSRGWCAVAEADDIRKQQEQILDTHVPGWRARRDELLAREAGVSPGQHEALCWARRLASLSRSLKSHAARGLSISDVVLLLTESETADVDWLVGSVAAERDK